MAVNEVQYNPQPSILMYNPWLVTNAFAPGMITIVWVSSITIAGPSTKSPTSKLPNRYTGVSSTRPIGGAKYTEYLFGSAFSFVPVLWCKLTTLLAWYNCSTSA